MYKIYSIYIKKYKLIIFQTNGNNELKSMFNDVELIKRFRNQSKSFTAHIFDPLSELCEILFLQSSYN